MLENCGASVEDVEHALLELLIRDNTIVVSINIIHDISPDFLPLLEADCATTKHSLKLILADPTIAILIEDLECLLEVWFGEQLDFVECRCDKLRVVHVTVAIAVSFFHHGDDIRLLKIENLGDARHVLLELIER